MPPRNMQTRMATTPCEPRRSPTRAPTNATSLAATPTRSKIMPARMNTGSASSGYFARLE
jgi:hypothetical protein